MNASSYDNSCLPEDNASSHSLPDSESMTQDEDSLEASALQYARLGWAVFPLHSTKHGKCTCGRVSCSSPGKHPRTMNGVKDATKNVDVIRGWWKKWPEANIGLATGVDSGRVVVDVDVKKSKRGDLSLQKLVEAHGGLPETLQAQTPSGGYHFVFQAPTCKMASPMNVREGIDILADGRYFVAAPSMIHGQPYQWIVNKPAAPCPQWVIDLANEKQASCDSSPNSCGRIIRELLPNGEERNGEWCALCPFHDDHNPSLNVRLSDGIFHCFACSASGNLAQLYAHFKETTEAEARLALGQTPDCIVELNNKHAVTLWGGKSVILTETHDPGLGWRDIVLSGASDLRLLYGNRKAYSPDQGKLIPIVNLWLAHPDRRQYEGVVFAPNRDASGYYNLWQGFAVESKKGDCSLYLAHLKDNIANGDPVIYEYLLSWMAHMIQRPDRRIGVSLVLRGKQGTGKGVMVTQLGKLLGKHFVHISQQKHFTGNFNAHFKDALLVFADEVWWAGAKDSEGPLKALVTEDVLGIELKGKDLLPVKNHVHLIIASNHDRVVPAGPEERRFCVLDVGEAHMQDGAYFQAIVEQMDRGGSEALLYLLEHYDLTGKDLRNFPQTDALLENKLLNMTSVQKFWMDRLVQGRLDPRHERWKNFLERKALHDAYCEFVKPLGQTRKASETELGMGLKKLVPGLVSKQRVVDGHRTGVWEFPDLSICRKAFDDALNDSFPWDTEINGEDGPGPP